VRKFFLRCVRELRDGLPMGRKRRDKAIRGAAENILEFPEWVPGPVAHLAHLMHNDAIECGADAESIELLSRLTCDPRMKRVWNELLRRKRTNYRASEVFLRPVRSGPKTFWTPEARARRRRAELIRTLADGEARAEVKELETWALLSEFAGTNYIFSGSHIFSGYEGPEIDRQQHALAFLFHEAFTLARQKPRPVSRTDAQTARSRYLAMAKCIAADNTERQRLHGFPDERLSRAPSAYLELADDVAPGPGSPLLVMRRHGRNESIKGFVMEFASTTKEIFGAPLFGTVATFANVALDRDDLTGEKVRKMLP
jgi:hypothetical protein